MSDNRAADATNTQQRTTLFGIDKGKIEILGDIVEPLDIEWEAAVDRDGSRVTGRKESDEADASK